MMPGGGSRPPQRGLENRDEGGVLLKQALQLHRVLQQCLQRRGVGQQLLQGGGLAGRATPRRRRGLRLPSRGGGGWLRLVRPRRGRCHRWGRLLPPRRSPPLRLQQVCVQVCRLQRGRQPGIATCSRRLFLDGRARSRRRRRRRRCWVLALPLLPLLLLLLLLSLHRRCVDLRRHQRLLLRLRGRLHKGWLVWRHARQSERRVQRVGKGDVGVDGALVPRAALHHVLRGGVALCRRLRVIWCHVQECMGVKVGLGSPLLPAC